MTLKKILAQISGHKNTDLIEDLTKKPLKEPKDVMPHTYSPIKFSVEQIDTLFLPSDHGYKYLLVVVDIATRLTDAEPMKSKSAEATKNALLKIYHRKILNMPHYLEADQGTEFKSTFKTYFEQYTNITYKLTGRSRQLAVVEAKNHILGTLLNKKMLSDEVATGKQSKAWVKVLPEVVRLINEHYSIKNIKPVLSTDQPRINKYSGNPFQIGSQVRVLLDKPKDFLTGSRLHGNFRVGDLRWSKEPEKITDYYLRPAQPLMYQLNNNKHVAYTKYQLQQVK